MAAQKPAPHTLSSLCFVSLSLSHSSVLIVMKTTSYRLNCNENNILSVDICIYIDVYNLFVTRVKLRQQGY